MGKILLATSRNPSGTLNKFSNERASAVALATLAVAGTAFAQSSVTLSGKLRFGYESATSATNAKTSGVGVTDGNVIFAATEDLGGGLKATASMDVRVRGRDTAADGVYAVTSNNTAIADGANIGTAAANGVRPRDASLTLSGGFGSVMVGAIEAGNGILGLVNAGGPTTYGLDNGTTLAGASNVDILKYTSPSFNGFSVAVATLDSVGGAGAQNGGANSLYAISYKAGALTAAADYTAYGSAAAATADKRTRVSASYNLGFGNVGVGFENNNRGALADKSERAVGFNMPVGPWLLGAVYASSKVTGTAGNNTGYDLAAQYNLSKTTYVALQYQSTKAAGATASASKYRVQLSKAF